MSDEEWEMLDHGVASRAGGRGGFGRGGGRGRGRGGFGRGGGRGRGRGRGGRGGRGRGGRGRGGGRGLRDLTFASYEEELLNGGVDQVNTTSPMKTIEGTESSSMMTGAKQATIGLGIAAMALYAVKAKRSKNSQKEVSSGEEDQIANDINIV